MSRIDTIFLGLCFIAALSTTGALSAEQMCKGQIQDACSVDNTCRWIKSYTRSDGKTVNGYCRNNSKKAATTAMKQDKPIK